MDYYTNVEVHGDNILYRGVKNGKRIRLKIPYKPTLYVQSKKASRFKGIHGENLDAIDFTSIKEAKDFIKQYEDVENFKIYGNQQFNYTYIADIQKGDIEWNINDLSIAIIDIEVYSEDVFPDPYIANHPITAITITYLNGKVITFGFHDYEIEGKEEYIRCKDEIDLCTSFLSYWTKNYPDVFSGWSSDSFDIPYLYNRFCKLLGDSDANKLSPWNIVRERKSFQKNTGKEIITYNVLGIAQLDYFDLYRTFAPNGKSQENYKLNNIANVEIGEEKISFEEYSNLSELYKKNFQKYIRYNIHDTTLILRMDQKLKLFELALTLAYYTKSNYDDVFTQTRMWDAIIYNHLFERDIIVPPKEISVKNEKYEGAYVKEPIVGRYNHIVTFDLTSLYPSLMIQYKISPEMLVEPDDYTTEMREIIADGVSVEKMLNQENDFSKLTDVAVTPNGQFFRRNGVGFLPAILEKMFEERKTYKNKMLESKKKLELVLTEMKRRKLKES